MRRHRRSAAVLAIATAIRPRRLRAGQRTAARTRRISRRGQGDGQITVWAMGAEGEKLGEFAKAFTADNPDAKVNVTAGSVGRRHQKIASAIAAKQTPDVSMIGTTWMGEFAKTGALDPTPPTCSTRPRSSPAPGTPTVVDGTSYGVPWYVETRLSTTARTWPSRPACQPPTNWEELKAIAKALKEKARRANPASTSSPAAPVAGSRSCRSPGPTAPTSSSRRTSSHWTARR